MTKKVGKRALYVDVPDELYIMFSKLCLEKGITRTEAIIQYLQYLKAKYYKHRELLHEHSRNDFELDERNS